MAAKAEAEAEERANLLAKALGDYETFCRGLIWIAPKDGKRSTLRWNPIQRKYNARRSWRDIVLKPRQIGFTTEELARDVYKFLEPGQRVLVMCQTDKDQTYLKKNSQDIQRMLDGLQGAGVRLEYGAKSGALWTLPKQDSALQLVESGASEAAAQKKGRGGTLTRVHCTEVAFYEYPDHSLNAMLEGVPQLPQTEVVFESTPNGVGNWFHDRYVAAEAGASGYKAHFFAWFEDPSYATALEPGEVVEPQTERDVELVEVHGITPEQLKWYQQKRAQKGSQDLLDQEYPSNPVRCFLTSGRNYFDREKLDLMTAKVRQPIEVSPATLKLFDGLRVWAEPETLEDYVIGVDPAEGLGEDGDWSYATVWHRRTHRHVATLRSKLEANPFADQLKLLGERYNNATIVVERNKGLAVIRALERIGYHRVFYDEDDKPGISTNTATRPVLLEELADAIRDQSLSTNDVVLLSEMRAFVVDPRSGKPYAPGKHRKDGVGDDGILSAAMAWRGMLRPAALRRAPKDNLAGKRPFRAPAGRTGW